MSWKSDGIFELEFSPPDITDITRLHLDYADTDSGVLESGCMYDVTSNVDLYIGTFEPAGTLPSTDTGLLLASGESRRFLTDSRDNTRLGVVTDGGHSGDVMILKLGKLGS